MSRNGMIGSSHKRGGRDKRSVVRVKSLISHGEVEDERKDEIKKTMVRMEKMGGGM